MEIRWVVSSNFNTRNMNHIKYYILSLLTIERQNLVKKNQERFPEIDVFRSINGYDIKETLSHLTNSKLQYHHLEFATYGTLANFLTKYNVLLHQIEQNIPFLCFIEDDLELHDNFLSHTSALLNYFQTQNINMVRLGKWGEGYITSLNGAKNIVQFIQKRGITHNIDNQLRKFSGQEFYAKSTPWTLKYETNKGDCLKTEKINLDLIK